MRPTLYTQTYLDAAVAAERERCAKIAEDWSNIANQGEPTNIGIAKAIRRGE